MSSLRIHLAQINPVVGDLAGNTSRILQLAHDLVANHQADLLLVPELALTGYPPEDLLLRPALQGRVEEQLLRLQKEVHGITLVVGYPIRRDGQLFNAAGVLHQGQWLAEYHKQLLPNDQVFDEKRYFSAGSTPCVVELQGYRLGLLICEDLWQPGPAAAGAEAGAEALLVLNASPWHQGKQQERVALAAERCQATDLPLLYCNLVGGQDELLFDGASFALDANGRLLASAPALQEAGLDLVLERTNGKVMLQPGACAEWPEPLAYLYGALVLGLKDYVNKSGFKGVVLGMSGGIDSALSAAIAVDALGADRVSGVMLPYHYTSSMSLEDAEAEARLLGIDYQVFPIAPMVDSFMTGLADAFAGTARDTTEENLQARCRGVLLMALSNKKGLMVLTTGNKSEVAVGYCTLYGDMVGGFNAIRDVYKTLVFELAEWRNRQGQVIPQRVIDRPPSAELAPGQKDEDSLPPYATLDRILKGYIEDDLSAEALIKSGFSRNDVLRVVSLVDRNEYKRRQAAPGVRVTARGFGKDRRYPIVNHWPVL
ncbi:NAD+ synthase [Marinospirillum alkaliphilum]|uniref:Glutamine-dependent NAD(+) synthetase n=1 Tax=Marinospirillum alkaliphilum DSM 21637 TaxID=1122209 RepID=A0A1K1ZNQ1_9GAMM|nr:NAD+ synthase [Marinospirillum alkaliphilum]SFX75882.1 NAD+ synthase (glutamine-hydrolysing) [Marinospirillum alkaliphilum DSM 21637]